MSVNAKGNATQFVWDLPSGKQVTSVGRNVSVSQHPTAETAELPADEGQTDGVVFFNDKEEVTIEAIIPVQDSDIAIGSILTFDSKSFAVMDWTKSWTRKDWAKVNITANAWKGVEGAQGHFAASSGSGSSGSGSSGSGSGAGT